MQNNNNAFVSFANCKEMHNVHNGFISKTDKTNACIIFPFKHMKKADNPPSCPNNFTVLCERRIEERIDLKQGINCEAVHRPISSV